MRTLLVLILTWLGTGESLATLPQVSFQAHRFVSEAVGHAELRPVVVVVRNSNAACHPGFLAFISLDFCIF